MFKTFRIFIGYDKRETIAYHVLSQSIMENSSVPVSITPIKLENLKKFYSKPKGPQFKKYKNFPYKFFNSVYF